MEARVWSRGLRLGGQGLGSRVRFRGLRSASGSGLMLRLGVRGVELPAVRMRFRLGLFGLG